MLNFLSLGVLPWSVQYGHSVVSRRTSVPYSRFLVMSCISVPYSRFLVMSCISVPYSRFLVLFCISFPYSSLLVLSCISVEYSRFLVMSRISVPVSVASITRGTIIKLDRTVMCILISFSLVYFILLSLSSFYHLGIKDQVYLNMCLCKRSCIMDHWLLLLNKKHTPTTMRVVIGVS